CHSSTNASFRKHHHSRTGGAKTTAPAPRTTSAIAMAASAVFRPIGARPPSGIAGRIGIAAEVSRRAGRIAAEAAGRTGGAGRGRGRAAEEIEEYAEGIREVDPAIVVGIGGVCARRRRSPPEE